MNDYWNDPPEAPEPLECCGGLMEIGEHGCWCPACGGFIAHRPDYEIPDFDAQGEQPWDDRLVNFPAKCPHGNEWFACDACDRESDFQADCYRERHR